MLQLTHSKRIHWIHTVWCLHFASFFSSEIPFYHWFLKQVFLFPKKNSNKREHMKFKWLFKQKQQSLLICFHFCFSILLNKNKSQNISFVMLNVVDAFIFLQTETKHNINRLRRVLCLLILFVSYHFYIIHSLHYATQQCENKQRTNTTNRNE